MKKLISYIQSKIDKYVIERFQKLMPKDLIAALYKRVAVFDLQITTQVVEVKKGKIRYTLFIAKDKDLKTVFNLGRHYEQKPTVTVR